jgi:predicted outer membrane repeat protein
VRWVVFLRQWGFRARGGGTTSIDDASFSNNFARTGGGGFAALGDNYQLSANISNCQFNNNRVQNEGFGGGIYVHNVNTKLTGNDFDRNQVFLPGLNSRGGAVAGVSCPGFAMTGGTVAHNRANYGGGLALKSCANPTVSGITFNRNFITMPPGTGEDIHTENCTGVTAGGLLNANQGSIPGRVVVVP